MGWRDDPVVGGWQSDEVVGEPQGNANKRRGEELPGAVQGLFAGLQGPLLGFADEVAGVGGAVLGGLANVGRVLGAGSFSADDGTTFGDRYRQTRDTVRGAVDYQNKQNPLVMGAAQIAASAPYMLVGAPAQGLKMVGGFGQAMNAAKTALPWGVAQGAGESTSDDFLGMVKDAAIGGGKSAALGGGLSAVGSAIGGGANATKRIFSGKGAADAAKLKVAEAMLRDEGGDAIRASAMRLQGLGEEARLADAGGKSTMDLLDTVATLPGASRNAVNNAILSRQAGRGGRIVESADDALGTGGRGFVDELGQLAQAKKQQSAPFYEALDGVTVKLDKDTKALIAKAPMGAWKKAREIMKAETGQDFSISELMAKRTVPFQTLDYLKRGLRDTAEAQKRSGAKDVGRAFDSVRQQLIARLDDLSPKDAGGSVYKQARETYSGFAGLEDAVTAGRSAWTDDVFEIAKFTKDMDPSTLDAFRVGALQALRQKAGSQSGQTQLMDFYKNPNTRDRLKAIFGDEGTLQEFLGKLGSERKMKALESVGRGSQTARRGADMGDLDVDPMDIAQAAKGNILSPIAGLAKNLWARTQMPEPVRDEIGRLLLSQGAGGASELNALKNYLEAVNKARAQRSSAIGTFAGVL